MPLFQKIGIKFCLLPSSFYIDTSFLRFNHCQWFTVISQQYIISPALARSIGHSIDRILLHPIRPPLPPRILQHYINICFARLGFGHIHRMYLVASLKLLHSLGSKALPLWKIFIQQSLEIQLFWLRLYNEYRWNRF